MIFVFQFFMKPSLVVLGLLGKSVINENQIHEAAVFFFLILIFILFLFFFK